MRKILQANTWLGQPLGFQDHQQILKYKIQIMLCNKVLDNQVYWHIAIGDLNVRQGFIQPNVFAKIDEKIPMNLDVVIYPNPFLESLSLFFFNEAVADKVTVEIYDMLGRLIFSNSYPPSQNVNVILDDFTVANYILKIQANNKQIVKKILKGQ
jgi:hypothetical protein